MLRLAVANRTETFERIQEPLADRGIAVEHLPYHERTFDLHEPAVEPADFDVGFVYPGRLMEGGVVDALADVPWVNGRRAVLTSRNKAEVLVRLHRAGLPTPATAVVSNPVDEVEMQAAAGELSFPLVVKPNSTTRGIGVAKVADADSLAGVVDYLDLVHDFQATGDKSYLLQEFVPDATDLRVMVIDGEYVGAVERTMPASAGPDRWKHNVHRGAEARGVTPEEDVIELAERTAAVLEIDVLGVDLLVGPEGPLINETNARPTIDDATKYESGFYDRLARVIRRNAP
jgi:ribosomal protein S6--L-glutamate ligase